jgi:hypothetical protein
MHPKENDDADVFARPRSMAAALTLTMLFALGAPLHAFAQDAAGLRILRGSTVWNAQERAAAEVIEEWVADWNARDTQKAAELMSAKCAWRGDPSESFRRGRAKLAIPKLQQVYIKEIYAIGGPTDTTVMIRRIDQLSFGPSSPMQLFPDSAFLRVKNGKIQEWLDVPIDASNVPPPPPPPAIAGRNGNGAAPVPAPPPQTTGFDCAKSSCE